MPHTLPPTADALTSIDPHVLTEAFRALWSGRTEGLGLAEEVVECPYTAGELADLAAQGRRPSYLPLALATQTGRARLGDLFPLLRTWVTGEDNVISNDQDVWGWFDYEASTSAPHTDIDEFDLWTGAARAGRTLLTINQYVVAAQDHHLLSGEYLDEDGSWSRLGSRFDGRAVACRLDGELASDAHFTEEPAPGCLLVAWDLGSGDRGAHLGARTSTVVQHVVPRIAPPRLSYDLERLPVPSVPDPAQERERLVAAFIALGYHEHLGLSADSYAVSFPPFGEQPQEYGGRFDVPLLVETRLSWREQAARAGIALGGADQNLDYVPYDLRSAPRTDPYVGWFTWWGQRFPEPIAPAEARKALLDDEVGANLNELIAMQVGHPELSEAGRFLEPLGYVLEGTYETGLTGFDEAAVRTACLYRWRGRAEISANLHPQSFSIFRPLIRGTVITEH